MSTAVEGFEAGAAGSRWRRFAGSLLSTGTIFLVLFVLLAWIAILNPNFLEPGPFLAYLKRAAPLVILAIGSYFVIVSGGFDLSVGSLVTVVVVVAARLIDNEPSRTWPVMALLLAIGAGVGLVNGLITTALRVPSFITTLGMLLILEGAVFLWTEGAPRGALSEEFRSVGREGIEGIPLIDQLPWSVLVLLALGAAAVFLMRSDYGRQLIATGDNDRAARLSGVRVEKYTGLSLIASATIGGVAGIMFTSLNGPSLNFGGTLLLPAFAAVFLGSTQLIPGRFNVWGTLLAIYVLATGVQGLQLVSGAAWLNEMFNGVALIIAVALSIQRTPSNFWKRFKERLGGGSRSEPGPGGSTTDLPPEEVSGPAKAASSQAGSRPN
jgi:ribose transport system permease protein